MLPLRIFFVDRGEQRLVAFVENLLVCWKKLENLLFNIGRMSVILAESLCLIRKGECADPTKSLLLDVGGEGE